MKTTTEPMEILPFQCQDENGKQLPQPKFVDAEGRIHITNTDDPKATNIFPGERRRREAVCAGLHVGPPRPTTSEVWGRMHVLIAAGIVGLYGAPIERENDKGKQP